MSKKVICLALGAVLLALSLPAEAQQPGKVPRIGYLTDRDRDRDSAKKIGNPKSEGEDNGVKIIGQQEKISPQQAWDHRKEQDS